jgi:hypothetical protein
LGNFIKAGSPKQLTNARQPRVIGNFEIGPGEFVEVQKTLLHFLGIPHHGPQFIDLEPSAATAGAHLKEKRGPRRIKFDREDA